MKLWTIQTLDVWDVLQHHGIFRATAQGIPDASFEVAYHWMVAQLTTRVGPPPPGCHWPIWAWKQWDGVVSAKPDLRARMHLPPGTMGVRLQIDIDDAQVLLSDFALWHYVLNQWFLATTLQQGEDFDDALERQGLHTTQPLPEPYQRMLIASWDRIFQLDWEAEDITHPLPHKRLQAVFWELHLTQVKRVDIFKAR